MQKQGLIDEPHYHTMLKCKQYQEKVNMLRYLIANETVQMPVEIGKGGGERPEEEERCIERNAEVK